MNASLNILCLARAGRASAPNADCLREGGKL